MTPDLASLARKFMDDGQGLEDKIEDYLKEAYKAGLSDAQEKQLLTCPACGATLEN